MFETSVIFRKGLLQSSKKRSLEVLQKLPWVTEDSLQPPDAMQLSNEPFPVLDGSHVVEASAARAGDFTAHESAHCALVSVRALCTLCVHAVRAVSTLC